MHSENHRLKTECHQVVIIGAGLSGLAAATMLNDQGVDVCVLEASNRVGGRMFTVRNEGTGYTDLGAAYISESQTNLLELLAQCNLKTYPVYRDGDSLCYRDGEVIRYSGDLPKFSRPSDVLDEVHFERALKKMCRQLQTDEPWKTPGAEQWDRVSFQQWLDNTITSKLVKEKVKMLSRANFSAEPSDVSLLWALWDMKDPGGINEENSGEVEKLLVEGGSQQLPDMLACRLKGRVLLEEAVERIDTDSIGRATVRTLKGNEFKASRVIIAIPPNAQKRITLDPPASIARQKLIQRVPMSKVIKTFIYYERAYWREQGLSGQLSVEDSNFPVAACVDDTKSDGSSPCIMGCISSDKATELSRLTKEQRRDQVAAQYAKMFNIPEMNHPIHYEEYNWTSDQWAQGGYNGTMAPGVLTELGWTLRCPEGPIHYAGSETASRWPGYMEGAIEAGYHAAREVLFALGNAANRDRSVQETSEQAAPASEPEVSRLEKIIPFIELKVAEGGIGQSTAASSVSKHVLAKL